MLRALPQFHNCHYDLCAYPQGLTAPECKTLLPMNNTLRTLQATKQQGASTRSFNHTASARDVRLTHDRRSARRSRHRSDRHVNEGVGAILLLLLTVAVVAATFVRLIGPEPMTSAFVLLVGYFFGARR